MALLDNTNFFGNKINCYTLMWVSEYELYVCLNELELLKMVNEKGGNKEDKGKRKEDIHSTTEERYFWKNILPDLFYIVDVNLLLHNDHI